MLLNPYRVHRLVESRCLCHFLRAVYTHRTPKCHFLRAIYTRRTPKCHFLCAVPQNYKMSLPPRHLHPQNSKPFSDSKKRPTGCSTTFQCCFRCWELFILRPQKTANRETACLEGPSLTHTHTHTHWRSLVAGLQPVSGCRSTLTFSLRLNMPTVG